MYFHGLEVFYSCGGGIAKILAADACACVCVYVYVLEFEPAATFLIIKRRLLDPAFPEQQASAGPDVVALCAPGAACAELVLTCIPAVSRSDDVDPCK
jgi:hypothetical protein